jgi:hypothetical protein
MQHNKVEKEIARFGGRFVFRNRRTGEMFYSENLVPDEGLEEFLDVSLGAAAKQAAWYLGIFEANYTPVAGVTAATVAAAATECTAYDETVRQTWTPGAVASKSIDNTASLASFTMNATKTIYGAFLVSSNVKGGTAGVLKAISQFSTPQSVVSGDVIDVGYEIAAA